MTVLLLNASYEPLAVITLRRAVSLILRDCVDGVTEEVMNMQTTMRSWEIPTVIRLRRYVNVPKKGVSWSRRAVLERDGYRCIYCGIKAGERWKGGFIRRGDFTLDHIIPRSRGGKNSWINTAASCPTCNGRKGGRDPHEAGMPLLWEPKTPRVNYWVVRGDMPEEWKIYIRG